MTQTKPVLELRTKFICSTILEETDKDIGTCLLIHIVVLVSRSLFLGTQSDSKSKLAMFLKSFWSSE